VLHIFFGGSIAQSLMVEEEPKDNENEIDKSKKYYSTVCNKFMTLYFFDLLFFLSLAVLRG
jgi:hypothetical protein